MKAISFAAVYVIWLREMKKFIRNKSRIIGNTAMPFFFLAFLGTGLRTSVNIAGLPAGLNYLDFLAPGIVGMVLLFSSMFAGISVLWDKQFGFLKEIMVAPVSRVSIVLGRIVAGITTGMIQAVLILMIAVLFLGVHMPDIPGLFYLLAFIVLISVSFVGLGISFASRMRDMHGFQLIMNFLIMPLFLLSGAFFTITSLPGWLSALAHINPLMYGVDGLRTALIGFGQLPIIIDFAVLLAFAVAMISLGTYLFKKTEIY